MNCMRTGVCGLRIFFSHNNKRKKFFYLTKNNKKKIDNNLKGQVMNRCTCFLFRKISLIEVLKMTKYFSIYRFVVSSILKFFVV